MQPQWQTAKGNCIPVDQLSNSHLENILRWIKRHENVRQLMRCETPHGIAIDIAVPFLSRVRQGRTFSEWIGILENEQARRQRATVAKTPAYPNRQNSAAPDRFITVRPSDLEAAGVSFVHFPLETEFDAGEVEAVLAAGGFAGNLAKNLHTPDLCLLVPRPVYCKWERRGATHIALRSSTGLPLLSVPIEV